MLTRFEVKGFKTLKDVAIDLGAVNVFIGANGSGKSNLLEALGFLGAITSGNGEYEGYRYRGVRPGDPESFLCQFPNRLSSQIEFVAEDEHTEYTLKLRPHENRGWEFIEETIRFDGKPLLKRSATDAVFWSQDQSYAAPVDQSVPSKAIVSYLGAYLNFVKQAFPGNQVKLESTFDSHGFTDRINNYAIFTPSTPQLRGRLGDVPLNPLGLGGSGLAKALEEMGKSGPDTLGPFDLDEVFDLIEWADGLATNGVDRSSGAPVQLRLTDRFMKEERNAVSALEASEGALYVLFLLALVGHERSPKMFAIDNFDQALHPRLARALTTMICDQMLADGTRQMFATTHNPLVLNGLNLLDDRIRLFTVDRDAAGASKVERVMVSEELMAKAEAGYPLSELWTSGWLGGGLPQNY